MLTFSAFYIFFKWELIEHQWQCLKAQEEVANKIQEVTESLARFEHWHFQIYFNCHIHAFFRCIKVASLYTEALVG